MANHNETLVAKGRGRRCDRRGRIVSVLTWGDLFAPSEGPTSVVVRRGWSEQGSAEAIVLIKEPVRGADSAQGGEGEEGPNVEMEVTDWGVREVARIAVKPARRDLPARRRG